MLKFHSIFSISKSTHLPFITIPTLNPIRFTPLYTKVIYHNVSTIKFNFKLRDGTLKPI